MTLPPGRFRLATTGADRIDAERCAAAPDG